MFKSAMNSWIDSDRDAFYSRSRRTKINVTNNPELEAYLKTLLISALKTFMPLLVQTYPKWTPSKIQTRSIYSTNAAIEEDYSPMTWHIENGDKLVTGIWYFKDPNDEGGGDLMMKNSIDGDINVIPYEENVLVFIPNIPTSWHRVSGRSASPYPRKFINFVIEQETTNQLHDYHKNDAGLDWEYDVVNNYK